ncbi:twin-arginine translocation signal domain-containing protein [Niabella sp. W65]|nr:twin-arginine translocation signal domain-containing protein [Niabella sp. W65]MCH7368935.1 twin-arginine translocation signal domain-containing protein [Niabella sp. W65]
MKSSRRSFIKVSGALAALAAIPSSVKALYQDVKSFFVPPRQTIPLTISINKKPYKVTPDTRTTLLDLLREELQLTGTKKVAITVSAAPARFI